jgi:hypothetical protein
MAGHTVITFQAFCQHSLHLVIKTGQNRQSHLKKKRFLDLLNEVSRPPAIGPRSRPTAVDANLPVLISRFSPQGKTPLYIITAGRGKRRSSVLEARICLQGINGYALRRTGMTMCEVNISICIVVV